MGMSRVGRIHEEQAVVSNVVFITETTALGAQQVLVDIDSSAGTAITVTLPPAAEMRGKMVSLYVTAYSGAITIADGSQSLDFTAPTFNGADDGQLLYSDGRRWWQFGTRT